MEKSIDFHMEHLGDFGTYQLQQLILHLLSAFTAGLHMMVLSSVAAVPDFKCAVFNETTGHHEVVGELNKCQLPNSSQNCDMWIYNKTWYEDTRTTEWNMICDQRWMGNFALMSYMLGVFTGAVVLGSLADKFGRKKIFCISAVATLVVSIGVAYVNNYWIFIVTTYVYGIFGSSGSYISGFVLTMELVGPSKRSVCGILFQTLFATGIMAVALWGYFIKNIFWIQIIFGLHSLLLIPHIWLIDESPKWLWGQGRKDEAIKIIQKALKINNKNAVLLSVEKEQIVSLENNGDRKGNIKNQSYSIFDLFKTPNLRRDSINICFFWFAASFGYYGITLQTSSLTAQGENPFIFQFVMAAVEMPSYIFVTLSMDRLGRRFLNSSMMIIGGLTMIIFVCCPKGDGWPIIMATSNVLISKFCIAGAFAIIYNYTVERYPTVVRNTAIGLGSMFARLGGGMTPVVNLVFDPNVNVPTLIFASVVLLSGIMIMVLPETLNTHMPQTMEDGEEFGKNDTCCTTGCFGRSKKVSNAKDKDIPLENY